MEKQDSNNNDNQKEEKDGEDIVKIFNFAKSKAHKMSHNFFSTVKKDTQFLFSGLKKALYGEEKQSSPKLEEKVSTPLIVSKTDTSTNELNPKTTIKRREIIPMSELMFGNEEHANLFVDLVNKEEIDLPALKELTKKGVPFMLRPQVWRLLLGITPTSETKQIEQKFKLYEEYHLLLLKHYQQNVENEQEDIKLHHQIYIDSIRTGIANYEHLFSHTIILDLLNRVLYIWSKENSSIGYYQGLNELVTPFILAYVAEYVDITKADALDHLTEENREALEIDCYFSLSKFLSMIANKYESNQGAVYAGPMIEEISAIIQRTNPKLHNHFVKQGLDYNVLCFRWALCLLCRDMKIDNLMKLFDNYLALGEDFPTLHPYVCASILLEKSEKLLPLEATEIMGYSHRVIPALYSQTTKDLIIPLIEKAIKLKEEDSKKIAEEKEKKSQENTTNENTQSKTTDDPLTNTAVVVGGIIVTLFATAIATYATTKKFKK